MVDIFFFFFYHDADHKVCALKRDESETVIPTTLTSGPCSIFLSTHGIFMSFPLSTNILRHTYRIFEPVPLPIPN